MKYKFIAVIFTCMLFLSGCWDKAEMEDREYVMTMGIDASHNTERLSMSTSMAVLESSAQNGEKEEGGKNYKEISGETMPSIMETADMYGSKQIYFGQTKSIIFGQELLSNRQLFKETLDTLERNQDINMKVIILASVGNSNEIVKAIGKSDNKGMYIHDFYKNTAKTVAFTEKMDFEQLLIDLSQNGNCIIPAIYIDGENIAISGGAVIKDYELQGYIDSQTESGLLWLKEKASGHVLNKKYNGEFVPIGIIKNTASFEFEEGKNNNILCRIKINAKGTIEGYSSKESLLFKNSTIDEIESIYEKAIYDEIMNSIDILKTSFNSDSINIISELKKRNYNLYLKHNNGDNGIFFNMEFVPEINLEIKGIGVIR